MTTVRITKIKTAQNTHVYRLANTGKNTRQLGPCDVCGGHVSEVHLQTEYIWVNDNNHEGGFWTNNGCIFGHLECLVQKKVAGESEELKMLIIGDNTWTVEK